MVVVATHDDRLVPLADRVVELGAGSCVANTVTAERPLRAAALAA
jgi:ABC-type lipoprotein export system ATPase subunit